MSRLRMRIARACLLVYPRAWRLRYGEEVEALLEEMEAGPKELVDLIGVGLRRRFDDLRGEHFVTPRINPWLAAVASCAAVLLAAPTAAFMLVNLAPRQLEWITGVRMPLGVGLVPGLEWILPALPFGALLVAVAPALRVSLHRPQEGGLAAAVRVRALPRPALAVVVVCAILVAAVIAYGIAENLSNFSAGA